MADFFTPLLLSFFGGERKLHVFPSYLLIVLLSELARNVEVPSLFHNLTSNRVLSFFLSFLEDIKFDFSIVVPSATPGGNFHPFFSFYFEYCLLYLSPQRRGFVSCLCASDTAVV